MKYRVEDITPQKAAKYLEQNTGNFRTQDDARVRRYAKDMKAGRWEENGEPLIFSDTELQSGQHRLKAVIMSGVTVRMLVVRGVQGDGKTLDTGKPRSVGQWLRHEGFGNANELAAISRKVLAHDAGAWAQKSWPADIVTASECIEYARGHSEGILSAARLAKPVPNISTSLLGAVLFMGSGRVEDVNENTVATWFADALRRGENLAETDAVLHLRNRLADQKPAARLTEHMKLALLTLAWNKTVLGETSTPAGLRLRLTGPGKQEAPSKILVAEE